MAANPVLYEQSDTLLLKCGWKPVRLGAEHACFTQLFQLLHENRIFWSICCNNILIFEAFRLFTHSKLRIFNIALINNVTVKFKVRWPPDPQVLSYRQQVGRSWHKHIPGSGGWSCPCRHGWRARGPRGWTSRTASPRWCRGAGRPHIEKPWGNSQQLCSCFFCSEIKRTSSDPDSKKNKIKIKLRSSF